MNGVVVLAALAAASTAALGAWSPAVSRLAGLDLARPEPADRVGRRSRPLPGAAVVAGVGTALAVAAVVGGSPGLPLGVLAGAAAARAVARRERPPPAAAVPPLALDLVAACLEAGARPDVALARVATAMGETAAAGRDGATAADAHPGSPLTEVAAALRLGTPSATAWKTLGDDPRLAGLVGVAARGGESGAALARALHAVADDARAEARAAALARARRAAVVAVLPLGLCALPAFVLLGVAPVVVALVRGALG